MASFTDISLVAQVAISGNRRAFDELVRRYQSPVRRFFLSQTLGDSQLSDDLAQDTFIKAYSNIRSFRGLASFQTWLMRIAYNVFYDYTRSKHQTEDVDAAPQRSASENVYHPATHRRLRYCRNYEDNRSQGRYREVAPVKR